MWDTLGQKSIIFYNNMRVWVDRDKLYFQRRMILSRFAVLNFHLTTEAALRIFP